MHPQPYRATCPDKEQLIENIRSAIHDIVELNARQMGAVIIGDFATLASIQVEIKQTRRRKESLLAAYSSHVHEHGC